MMYSDRHQQKAWDFESRASIGCNWLAQRYKQAIA